MTDPAGTDYFARMIAEHRAAAAVLLQSNTPEVCIASPASEPGAAGSFAPSSSASAAPGSEFICDRESPALASPVSEPGAALHPRHGSSGAAPGSELPSRAPSKFDADCAAEILRAARSH